MTPVDTQPLANIHNEWIYLVGLIVSWLIWGFIVWTKDNAVRTLAKEIRKLSEATHNSAVIQKGLTDSSDTLNAFLIGILPRLIQFVPASEADKLKRDLDEISAKTKKIEEEC